MWRDEPLVPAPFGREARLEECSDEGLGRMLDGGFEEGAHKGAAESTGVRVRLCRGTDCDGLGA